MQILPDTSNFIGCYVKHMMSCVIAATIGVDPCYELDGGKYFLLNFYIEATVCCLNTITVIHCPSNSNKISCYSELTVLCLRYPI